MKVFVTGCASHFAAALLPRLCEGAGIEQVTGIDIAPPSFSHAKFRTAALDVRSPGLETWLVGHDALVHLAWVKRRGKLTQAQMFDINVTGSHKLFHAARRAGVNRLIHLSSAAIYGGGVHLDESAALDPPVDLPYVCQQAHFEKLLQIEFPESVRLRPHLILGPNAHPSLRRWLRLPLYVHRPLPYPLMQCVHEEDVARAVLLALERPTAGGPFNLAADEPFDLREAAGRRHKFALPVPPFVARAALALVRRSPVWDGELAWIGGLSRTLLVNCRRAAVELGWRSTRGVSAVLEQG